MFQGLRQHSVLYILDKTDLPTLKIGQVVSVTNPQPKYQLHPTNQFTSPEMYVDISVKVGDDTMEFKQLPANESTTSKNGIWVSDSRDAMISEIETIKMSSINIIDSVSYNEKVIAQCDIMLKEINPQFAKDKERDDRLNGLEDKMGGMETTLTNIQSMLSQFLNHNSKEDKV